ncbi:MAG: hypothetical protein LBK61_06130 [Spirochaetaceae bacterium]|jgi:hypothetical protein|nr:hypothetical protein [Spirochaetaceae bacterium]
MNGNGGRAGVKAKGRPRNRGGQVSGLRENGDDRGMQTGGHESGKREWSGGKNKKPAANNRRTDFLGQRLGSSVSREKKGRFFYDRPKWTPVKKPDEPIPELVCSLCGKPIADISSAICGSSEDKASHFDCIIAQIKQSESLGEGDSLAYIGGGRFGIVCHDSHKKFTIKKIIDWDQRDDRVPWRKLVADHFSST